MSIYVQRGKRREGERENVEGKWINDGIRALRRWIPEVADLLWAGSFFPTSSWHLPPQGQEGGKNVSVVVGQWGWRKLRESDLITPLLFVWRWCHFLSEGGVGSLKVVDVWDWICGMWESLREDWWQQWEGSAEVGSHVFVEFPASVVGDFYKSAL